MELKLTASELEQLITKGFGHDQQYVNVDELRPGFLRCRLPFVEWMRRPGNIVSGPALFTIADLALYMIVLAHTGPTIMAVTTDVNVRFLNRGKAGEQLTADATLLKLGSRSAVVEVRVRCGDEPNVAAHMTGSLSLPAPR